MQVYAGLILVCLSFCHIGCRSDYLKLLMNWFAKARTCTKTWEECVAGVQHKLSMWEQRSLSIVVKNVFIRCEALTLLLYVAQVWPIPHSCTVAVTGAIFRFIWGSKMDRVRRDTMFKPLDKGGKNVPNVALILMTTFVCGCIKLCVELQYANSKCHYVLRFSLCPVLRRMDLVTLPQNAPSSWTVPYHLSVVEQFLHRNTFDHRSIRQWSARNVLKALREKEMVDSVG
ncbi:uncharacterized protein [Heterodontus francisci]|uniref:uncharacterized protein isoform X1 n=2 Tax=Heterodontus francisci TaxID=7792 RepID=UPI00355C9494